jgi:hypothetical protein
VGDAAAWETVGPVDVAFLNAGVATGSNDGADFQAERLIRTSAVPGLGPRKRLNGSSSASERRRNP